jgi:hypothetical protein
MMDDDAFGLDSSFVHHPSIINPSFTRAGGRLDGCDGTERRRHP